MLGQLLILSQDRLKLHPKNIRLYYAPKDVEEMAGSLAGVGARYEVGNLQALLVTEIEEQPGYFYVIEGNLRLVAGRSLGEKCPPFKCEVISASQAEQLLMMAVSGMHFPKDLISQGKHFERLIYEEGYTQAEIAQHTGIKLHVISKCLAALELDEEIQQLFIERKLKDDIRFIRALKGLPEKRQRVEVAQYYAGRDTAIGTMVMRVRLLAAKIHHLNGNGAAYQAARHEIVAKVQRVEETKARNKTRQRAILDAESATRINGAAQRILCEGCSLLKMKDACTLCPGPMEFMAHLGELVEATLSEGEQEEMPANVVLIGPEQVRERLKGFEG